MSITFKSVSGRHRLPFTPLENCFACLPPLHRNARRWLVKSSDFLALIGGDPAKMVNLAANAIRENNYVCVFKHWTLENKEKGTGER